ncbi:tyrosine-protein phosphatase non-receptor type 23-like [Hyla sarda]|uniref:tyrosine-protein phosphatase non-receptor type 23-like n=1 Tax=Hyla sarda TaxID=327740 RepID=UPI0024C2EBBC|nr:tyrosine-protein phosphatase non-receptor type 23-like [Hyla sarda]
MMLQPDRIVFWMVWGPLVVFKGNSESNAKLCFSCASYPEHTGPSVVAPLQVGSPPSRTSYDHYHGPNDDHHDQYHPIEAPAPRISPTPPLLDPKLQRQELPERIRANPPIHREAPSTPSPAKKHHKTASRIVIGPAPTPAYVTDTFKSPKGTG